MQMLISKYSTICSVVISMLLLLTACNSREHTTANIELPDLKKIIYKEAVEVQRLFTKGNKTAAIGDKQETMEIDLIHCIEIIKALEDADINKPALQGAYKLEIDTLEEGTVTENYIAILKKPSTRLLSITTRNGQFEKLKIEVAKRNFIYHTEQQISYQHLKGYQIKTRQKVVMGTNKEFEIIVQFR